MVERRKGRRKFREHREEEWRRNRRARKRER